MGTSLIVTGRHDHVDTTSFEPRECFWRGCFDCVGYSEKRDQTSIDRYLRDRLTFALHCSELGLTLIDRNLEFGEEPGVADGQLLPFDCRGDSGSGVASEITRACQL